MIQAMLSGSKRFVGTSLACMLLALGAVGCSPESVTGIAGAIYHPFTGLALPVQLVEVDSADTCDGTVVDTQSVEPFGQFSFTPDDAGDYCVRMIVAGLDPIDGANESQVYAVDPDASDVAVHNMMWAPPPEESPGPAPDPVSKGGIEGVLDPDNTSITVTLYKYDGMELITSGSFTGSYALTDTAATGDDYITVATSAGASDVSDSQYSLHQNASGNWPNVDLDVSQ